MASARVVGAGVYFADAAAVEVQRTAFVEVGLAGWVDLVDLGWVKMEAGVAV